MHGRLTLPLIQITVAGMVCLSCATFKNDFTPVQLDRPMLLVTEYPLVKDCELLNSVSAESLWGGCGGLKGGDAQWLGRRRVILNMLGAAEKAGGNVVFLQVLKSDMWGAEGHGIAYHCPDLHLDKARQVTSTETYGGNY